MGKKLTKYDALFYVLSCGHGPAVLIERIANTCRCVRCHARVFILEARYDRVNDDD